MFLKISKGLLLKNPPFKEKSEFWEEEIGLLRVNFYLIFKNICVTFYKTRGFLIIKFYFNVYTVVERKWNIAELLFKVVTVKYMKRCNGLKTNIFPQLWFYQNYRTLNFICEHIIFSVLSVSLVDAVFFIKFLCLKVIISWFVSVNLA